MPELNKTYWRDLPLQFTPKRVQNLDETALESLVKNEGIAAHIGMRRESIAGLSQPEIHQTRLARRTELSCTG